MDTLLELKFLIAFLEMHPLSDIVQFVKWALKMYKKDIHL